VKPSLDTVAARLYADVMAPLVLGGAMRPARVIGPRAATALAALQAVCADVELERRVQVARVRQARKLVPIDELGPASEAEWKLATALNDILQCANPTLDRPLRRRAAARILDGAELILDGVGAPASVLEALSRHSWLARVFDIARKDTRVSWWVGSRTFLGVEPSPRFLAWPHLRRVKVEQSSQSLLFLAPPAIGRDRLALAVGSLLERTPLTDIATCTRGAPPFGWSDTTLAFVATREGRTLAIRALARLQQTRVDAALGRATRDALDRQADAARAAVALLADRAMARVQVQSTMAEAPPEEDAMAGPSPSAVDAALARDLGAAAAKQALESEESGWPESERRRLLTALGES
jgi:hypothetical protein